MPGPGTYRVRTSEPVVNTVIGDEKRFKYERSQSPGPGQYRIPGGFGFLQ